MVGGIESNVVDGPISWRAVPADSLGAKENGSFWFREAGRGTRAGSPEQNYAGLRGWMANLRPYGKSQKQNRRQIACCFSKIGGMDEGSDFSPVIRHSFEMAPYP